MERCAEFTRFAWVTPRAQTNDAALHQRSRGYVQP
jgi:hypothetical protein